MGTAQYPPPPWRPALPGNICVRDLPQQSCTFDILATAATIDCPNELNCKVRCIGQSACRNNLKVRCPKGRDCLVLCDGQEACRRGLTIDCSGARSCELVCMGQSACRNDFSLGCQGAQSCHSRCYGQEACRSDNLVRCDGSSSCNVTKSNVAGSGNLLVCSNVITESSFCNVTEPGDTWEIRLEVQSPWLPPHPSPVRPPDSRGGVVEGGDGGSEVTLDVGGIVGIIVANLFVAAVLCRWAYVYRCTRPQKSNNVGVQLGQLPPHTSRTSRTSLGSRTSGGWQAGRPSSSWQTCSPVRANTCMTQTLG